jgi:putative transposase
MPDHLHALVEALVENADFRHFVKVFKQMTAFNYRRRNGSDLWQPGYHERIVRDEEATEAIVRYIWENPIRGGITKELGEYPFCGSDRYELSDIIDVWARE